MSNDESHSNVFINCEGQSHKTVSTDHNLLKRKESRSGTEPGDSGSVPMVNLVDRTGDSYNIDRERERKALLDEDNSDAEKYSR